MFDAGELRGTPVARAVRAARPGARPVNERARSTRAQRARRARLQTFPAPADDEEVRFAFPARGVLFACACLASTASRVGANDRSMSLDQVITYAQAHSSIAVQARNRFRASYWEYRTQRAAFLPTLSLHATAP